MNRYLKLVHMEIHRFRYLLAALLVLVATVQWGSVAWSARSMVAMLDKSEKTGYAITYTNELLDHKISYAEAIYNAQQFYILSVLAVVGVLSAYLFFIWYRDWLGRNTFVYRLLMLPAARSSFYLAKLTAFLVFVFAALAFQSLSLAVGRMIYEVVVPSGRQTASYFIDVIDATLVLQYVMPERLGDFALHYGLGIVAVLIIFTGILIERSYRWTGIAYAVGYVLACAAAIVIPINAMGMYRSSAYLYTAEIVGIELAIVIMVAAVSVWLGFRLIRRKVTV